MGVERLRIGSQINKGLAFEVAREGDHPFNTITSQVNTFGTTARLSTNILDTSHKIRAVLKKWPLVLHCSTYFPEQ